MTKKILGAIFAVSILAVTSTAIAAEHHSKKSKNPAVAECKKEHKNKKSAEYKACVKAAKEGKKEAHKDEHKDGHKNADNAGTTAPAENTGDAGTGSAQE